MTPPRFLHPFARVAAGSEAYISIVRGQGCTVWDDLGTPYLDALASLWYCNVGHGRGEIGRAVAAQMEQLEVFHTFERFTNPPAEALCDRLAASAPMPDARVFLTSGGSEAVETAFKLCRLAHGTAGAPERTLIISRVPSYHGVTYGAMSATGLPLNQAGFGPLLPQVVGVGRDDLGELDALLAERGPEVAAIIAEPVIGAGGVYPPAPGYLEGLRERCDRYGAFLILDEVICGFGRLGSLWASAHYGVRPDLVTFAKAVTSGYAPLGGVLVGPAVSGALAADPTLVLRHGYTYSGHPSMCAAALANLDIVENEDLPARAVAVGAKMEEGFRSLVDGDAIVEARGAGAVWAVELGGGRLSADVREELLARGVIARPLGTTAVAFCPPLVITDAEVARMVEATGEAARAVHPA